MVTFNTLIGKKMKLVGYSEALNITINNSYYTTTASCTFIKLEFNNEPYIIKIIEDPVDGYRSSLGDVIIIDETDSDYKNAKFNKLPPVKVTLIHNTSKNTSDGLYSRLQDVYIFKDDLENIWFTFGTDNVDDYYPYYICYPNEFDIKAYRDAIIGDILDE